MLGWLPSHRQLLNEIRRGETPGDLAGTRPSPRGRSLLRNASGETGRSPGSGTQLPFPAPQRLFLAAKWNLRSWMSPALEEAHTAGAR